MNAMDLQQVNIVLFEKFNELLEKQKLADTPHRLSTVAVSFGYNNQEIEIKTIQTVIPKSDHQGPKIIISFSAQLAGEQLNPAIQPLKPVAVSASTQTSKSTPPPLEVALSKIQPNGDPASKETKSAMLAAVSKSPSAPSTSEEDHGFRAVPAVNNKRKIEDTKGKGKEEEKDDMIVLFSDDEDKPSSSQPEKKNPLKKTKK
jgi:hypothetical protein